MLGALGGSRNLSGALTLDLGAGNRRLDSGEESATVGREVCLAVRRGEKQATLLGGVDPVLELARLTGEPVEGPNTRARRTDRPRSR